jgi:hypothetical protein
MSNTPTKFAIALFLVLATPAASFARGGGGPAAAGNSGSAAAGTAAGRASAAAIGTATSVLVDPSGIGNASKVAAPPPPKISVPAIPQFK